MKVKMKVYKLITENLASRVAESYRVIRTNIQFASLENPLKTLLITSAAPSEGKSTTVANLAIVFAQTGSRVLLLDADLRRPTMHKIFNISNPVGLTSLLLQTAVPEIAIRDTGIMHLKILTSGPTSTNPSEILGSRRMHELLARFARDFDYIIIDSSPVLAVTDSCILASMVDGVVIVVAADEVSIDKVKKAKQQLQSVKANILGVVLNGLEHEGREEYYYYYGRRSGD
ncbi:MAG: CpsD/CapB family tyrosine-protein kinase [bacterium]|nr:CpsD/CapB family tyrosine-protein kinase [bacterium]